LTVIGAANGEVVIVRCGKLLLFLRTAQDVLLLFQRAVKFPWNDAIAFARTEFPAALDAVYRKAIDIADFILKLMQCRAVRRRL
jgi:hypothetical protein